MLIRDAMTTDPHAMFDMFPETAVTATAAAKKGNTKSPATIVMIK
jgi:hypothetical protein